MQHSFLPPSGASAWSRCAQWATMNKLYPQDESAASIEGTAAHWVGWEIYIGRPISEGVTTPNGQIVTGEMLEGGELLSDTMQTRGALIPKAPWHIEETISIPFIDSFGTPDAWGFDPANMHLEIIDYKYGHRFVDEYFNAQGLSYLLGILHKLNPHWRIRDQISVSFTVVQPRCYYKGSAVRTHSFYLTDAATYFNALSVMATAARCPSPVATTNPHCSDCPGRHACSALQQAAYSDAEFSTDRQPVDLSPAAAGLELVMLSRSLDRLQARVDGLNELTTANLKAGLPVRYFHIEQGNGRSQWNIPNDQLVTIGKMLGKDLSKPGVITPVQAKKLGIDEAVIKAYSFTPTGNLKLVADNPADARRVFGQGE